ncbi:MAG: hypothetical protein H6865_04190 [Rhodospirillales bacterium]|nr:hypothetical protein [Alphaproteobacteria bacterium]MCB9986817.1 hypothetical protein [Rhodospirillales bacterium]USO08418.1 MAG: hypothetical protein H6866_04190 [Rhodospirillales bacterium]
MNVKLAGHEVIFKISETELYELERAGHLELKIMLGGMVMAIEITVSETIQKPVLHLSTDRSEACLGLSVTLSDITNLKDKGKDRDGLMWFTDGTKTLLQVDLKTDTRPRKAS